MRGKALTLAAVLMLGGCTTARTTALDSHTFLIESGGSAFNSMGDVYHRVLIEAATVTKANGFRWFYLTSQQQGYRGTPYFIPGQTYTTYNGTYMANPTGGTLTGSAVTTQTPSYSGVIYKPGMNAVAVAVPKPADAPPGAQVWDADDVLIHAKD